MGVPKILFAMVVVKPMLSVGVEKQRDLNEIILVIDNLTCLK